MMRIFVAVLAALWAGPVWAEVALDSPNGTRFRIDDLGDGGLDGPGAFSAWPQLCVRAAGGAGDCAANQIYTAGGAASAREVNNRQVVLATDQLAGLNVRRKVFVPNAGSPLANGFVRYLDLLTNPTGAPITVSVRVGTVAAGTGQVAPGLSVWRTQKDDPEFGPDDRWVVIDDANAGGGAAALGTLMWGAGRRVEPARAGLGYPTAGDARALAWDYDGVTVPPGQTVALLTIVVHEVARAAAIDEVDSLLRVRDADALFGLTDDERRQIANFDVDPVNGAALADAGGPYNAEEGQQLQLSAAQSFDPEGQPLTYEWDFDGDGDFDDADGQNAFHRLGDDGVYIVSLRVTDAGGKVDVDTGRIVVRNVDPRVDGINTDSPIDEGSRLNVDVQVTDPGTDELLYDFDWDGDGVYDEVGVAEARWDHAYPDDGVFDVGVRVRDDDGGVGTGTVRIVVDNVAPVIRNINVPPQVAEGSEFFVIVTATDPGLDTLTYSYDIDGDDIDDHSDESLDRLPVTFGDNGLYPIRVTVCDEDGACSEREQTVNIGNVRPTIVEITDDGPVPEGSPLTLTINATDPAGPNDPLRYSVDWDNDGQFDDDVVDSPDAVQQHVFLQQGLHFVGVRVRDDDNGIAVGNTRVEVTNVAPTAAIDGPAGGLEGQPLAFTCTGDDPGDDQLSYDWDLDGDGEYEVIGGGSAQSPAFRTEGRFTVSCRVSDGDGGVDTAGAEVIISNQRPTLDLEYASPQNEGAEVVVRANAVEPGDDTLTYSFDFDDDGVFEIEGAQGAGAEIGRHVYPDQGLFTVRVVVDDGTDSIDATGVIDVVNVAPSLLLSSNAPVDEGSELVLTAEVADPGDDTITIQWDLDGDGEVDAEEVAIEDLIERAALAADDATYDVTVIATDEDGGSTTETIEVVIDNVAPSFPENFNPPPAQEGLVYPGTVPANDPAGAADPLVFALLDPPPGVDIQPQTGQILWTPDYDDYLDSPTELTVRVDDQDGGQAIIELSIDVLPRDEDGDGLPDTYEERTCDQGVPVTCLDPANPGDAREDPDGDGRDTLTEWMEQTDPFYFEGPVTPTPQSPVDGGRIDTLTPALVVSWVDNPIGTPVQIVFEIYADAELQNLVIASDPVGQDDDEDEALPTSWVPPDGLLFEDQWYYWRARAVAGDATSDWSFSSSFRTNATNEPPTAPVLVGPPDGATVDTRSPTFTALPSTDIDEDELRYIFNIYDVRTQTGVGQLVGGMLEFTPSSALSENAVIEWEVVAVDTAGAMTPSGNWSFRVDSENAAPTPPEFIEPVTPDRGPASVASLTPAIVVGGAEDEDGDPVRYVVAVYDATQSMLIEEGAPLDADEAGQATWTPSAPLTENGTYMLAAHALDDADAASETTTLAIFVSAVDEPPPVPELQSPADGVTIAADSAVMLWGEVEDPEGAEPVVYILEYCNQDDVCEEVERERTSYGITETAEPGETYTWTVRARDPAGNTSARSAPRVFAITRSAESVSEGCGCEASDRAPTPWTLALLVAGLLGLRRRRR